MTGFHPDHEFLIKTGVKVDSNTRRPFYDEETMETNVANLFVAGAIAAGNNANEFFIENGKLHGEKIVSEMLI